MKAIETMYRSRVEYNTLSTVNVHSEVADTKSIGSCAR